jgi:hypothetical protein
MHNIYKILQERPSAEYIIRSVKHVEPTPTPVKEVEQLDAVVKEVPAVEEAPVEEETPAAQEAEQTTSSETAQTKKATRKKKQ